MFLNEIIDQIECEMVCANRCPQWNTAPYDSTKCRCYKRECIEVIEQAVIDIQQQAEQIEKLSRSNEIYKLQARDRRQQIAELQAENQRLKELLFACYDDVSQAMQAKIDKERTGQ